MIFRKAHTYLLFSLLVLFVADATGRAQTTQIAPTPPMGWNSWDAYAQNVTEAQVRENADFIAKNLKQYGWSYIVIDEGWYLPDPPTNGKPSSGFVMDENGRYLPVTSRFPTARSNSGFKSLGDYLHGQGLKFGLHLLRGIPKDAVQRNLPIADSGFHAGDAADQSDTCPWNTYNFGVKDNAAGQAYYDSLARQLAAWGVDFIKVDCISDHPYKGDEIRMIRQALDKTDRPIVLSLSPGPTSVSHAEEVRRYAEMWRISDDFWDHWGTWPKHEFSQGLLAQFATAAKWAKDTGDGHWADADMLPIGHLGPHAGEGEVRESAFTHDEARTLLTFWAIFRSPLMVGANLPATDPFTLGLLSNPEVIAVDQHSTGNQPVITNDHLVIWIARPDEGTGQYLAAINTSDQAQAVEYSWEALGLQNKSYKIRDLWEKKELGKATRFRVMLAPHASILYGISTR
jgi:hypothetical protein